MDNETLFKAICEMVKQYENEKDEDLYREKCIQLVYNTFNINDAMKAEILFDIALYWEGDYLADTLSEIMFNIVYKPKKEKEIWRFECTLDDNTHFHKTVFKFPSACGFKQMLDDLDYIWKDIEEFDERKKRTSN